MGLLQGVTEFLPVSSSGHLVLIPWFLGWESPSLAYDTVVHLGTLLASGVHFRRDILSLLLGWWQSVRYRRIETVEARLSWLIMVSALPGGLLSYLAGGFFESLFGSPRAVSGFLLVTGVLLVVGERLGRQAVRVSGMNLVDALCIGLAQGCAIAPGISRSGATISAGLLRGLTRSEATRFAFLMAMPIIAGAAGIQLLGAVSSGLASAEALPLALGFIAAAVGGYAALGFLLRFLRANTLRPFAYYCWAIGAAGLAVSFLR